MTSIPISSSFIGLRKTSLTGIKNIGDSFFYFLLIFSLCCTLTIRAQTYVSRTGSDNVSCGSSSTPCSTLQYAIDKTPNQGSILVMPGTYSGHGNRGITFPGKTVNITSVGGPNVTILDAMGADRHFLFVAQEAGWIDGFTIINGMATSGGCALYTMASLSFKNSVFRNCTAKTVDGSTVISGVFPQGGGALLITNSNPSFINVDFISNSAFKAAGSVFLDNGANATFTQCTFTGDTALSFGGSVVPEGTSDSRFYNCSWRNCVSNYGGAVDTGSTSTTEFHGCLFENCQGQTGGAIYHYNSDSVKVYDTVFRGCSASTNGGAVTVTIQCAPIYVNCTFYGNTAPGVGGAFYVESTKKINIYNSTFMNSRASGGGGGLYGRTNSVVNAENCVFENNYALYGGAILFEDYSTLSLKNIVCSSNLVDVDGGCLKLSNQVSGSVNDSTFFNNTAKTEGGGIQIGQNSQVTFRNILVRGNFAEGLAGGALHTGSSIVNYIDSVFESNTCNSNGGGMGIKTQAHVVVQNTIFQKNHARGGGAIYTDSKGGLSALNNCSFLNNTASFGGAAFFDLGTQKNIISDAIMMGNQADAGGTFFYNVWQRLLEFNNITFVENKAIYGDIEATKPWKMIPLPLATTEFSPKDTFSVTLKLIDFFNNTAVSTVNQIIVNMRGSEGMTVQSIFYLQPFINGFVTFSNVAVAGRLQESYSLSFSSTELPNVIIPVTIVSCGPGYAKTSVDGDVYTCARCPSGQYSLVVDGACRICPPGGDCSNGGANLTTLEGWWMDPASLVSNDPKLYNCEAGTCLGQSKCAANREGRICSKCVDGFSEWNNECQDCRESTSPEWMLVPYVFGLIYCGLLINFPKLTEAGIPKSLAFFVQSSLILFSSDSRTSSQSIVKFFNLAFDWIVIIDYRHKCILNLNPIKRLTYNYYEPLAPLLSIFTWYIIFKLYYLVVHRSGIPSKWNWRIIGSLIWVFLWCYILLAKASFSLINCTTIGDAYVLSAAPNVICYSPEHIPYMIGAWFVIVAYIIGFPFLCGGLLWYAKKKIATNPGYPLCKELYRTYQPTFWFYEIVLIFRKLILTLLDVFLLKYPVEHNLMLSIFFYVIFFIQYWMQPFKNKMFNLAEDFVLMTLILLGGFSLSDTMRVYYLSTIDINLVGLVFTSVCFLSILCLIFFMSTTGNLLMDKLVSMSPFLARIVHSIRQRSEKVHQWGSAFSMDEKKQGSTNTVDGRKSNLSNDATKNSSNNLKKSQASNMEHSAPIRSFPMIEESSKKPSNLALT